MRYGHTQVAGCARKAFAGALLLSMAWTVACKRDRSDRETLEAPPAIQAPVQGVGSDLIHVDQPSRFSLTRSSLQSVVSKLSVTGTVSADVSREIPVLSLANGRIVALHVGLGDTVHKGQLIMEVQSADASAAFANYLKAVSDEHLSAVTLTRDKLLYDKGAIAQSQLQVAENGEDDARAALNAADEQLRILGFDKNHPSDTVKVYAPASGVIIAQNATAAGAAGIGFAGPSGSLTIADLSHVWVICDVYENDLSTVHLGEHADIRLNAFSGKTYSGTISDIGAVLDPSIRTAKIRIQVPNPGNELRIGMFATAALSGSQAQAVVVVPATAVLHLHDHEYLFVPQPGAAGSFRRVTVKMGRTLDGNMAEILTGLDSGQQVVVNALDMQNTVDGE